MAGYFPRIFPSGTIDHFVGLLEAPDRRGAISLVTRLAESGTRTEDLILDLLAPAGREVGARWARREWSVAREHAATAVADSVLAVLTANVEVPVTEGRMIVACVEGEWHSVTARMAGEVLRLRGWDVTFLGPSVPAQDLGAHIAEVSADAVGLSCSVPLFLIGAQRSIEACHRAGVPVVAGGAGFGEGGRYAAALGADAWVDDPRAAPRLADLAVGAGPVPHDGTAATLELLRPALVAGTARSVALRGGGHPTGPAMATIRETINALVTAVACASIVDDPSLITTCLPSIGRLLPDELDGEVTATDLAVWLLPELREHSERGAQLCEDALLGGR